MLVLEILDTKNSDYAPYSDNANDTKFLQTHDEILSQFLSSDYKLIKSYEGINTFLLVNYRIQAFLKNNENLCNRFIVKAGDLNEIHALPYPPKILMEMVLWMIWMLCPLVPGVPNKDLN